jgi:uncharacterized protein
MPFSMSQAALPVFEINLSALSAILDKADAFATAKKIDPAVLLYSRLSPDMFDLTRQIQVATDGARRGSARLAGVEPPSYEDNETTIAQLKDRIAKTVAFLKTLDRKQIDAAADREITFPLGGTNKGQMKGDDYLNHFMLPNFYFHCTAAYAILRHCGVDIGKRDFLGAIPLKMVLSGGYNGGSTPPSFLQAMLASSRSSSRSMRRRASSVIWPSCNSR